MRSKSVARMLVEPIVIAVGLALLVRAAVHLYAIPSESMAPTLQIGDQIVVTRYFAGPPERGDIVVFERDQELLVKRVIGVPGDLIDSRLGRVRVGGYTLAEPYLMREAATGAIDSQLVPRDCYYVLGDNREVSIDSRNHGFVPRGQIVGRVRLVLWSAPWHSTAAASAATHGEPPASRRLGRRVFKWVD